MNKSEKKVKLIEELSIEGLGDKEIAEQLDVSKSQINYLRTRYNIKRYCKICGKEITGNKIYCEECSEKCESEKSKKRIQKFRLKKKSAKTESRVCPICGSTFLTSHSIKKYCSRDCYLLANEIYFKTKWYPKYKEIFNAIPGRTKGLTALDEYDNLEENVLSDSEISTHGDLFSINHNLGTSNLGSKPEKDREIEAKKVKKEYNRIFGTHEKLDEDLFREENEELDEDLIQDEGDNDFKYFNDKKGDYNG